MKFDITSYNIVSEDCTVIQIKKLTMSYWKYGKGQDSLRISWIKVNFFIRYTKAHWLGSVRGRDEALREVEAYTYLLWFTRGLLALHYLVYHAMGIHLLAVVYKEAACTPLIGQWAYTCLLWVTSGLLVLHWSLCNEIVATRKKQIYGLTLVYIVLLIKPKLT